MLMYLRVFVFPRISNQDYDQFVLCLNQTSQGLIKLVNAKISENGDESEQLFNDVKGYLRTLTGLLRNA
jgi:hypothetical protein